MHSSELDGGDGARVDLLCRSVGGGREKSRGIEHVESHDGRTVHLRHRTSMRRTIWRKLRELKLCAFGAIEGLWTLGWSSVLEMLLMRANAS